MLRIKCILIAVSVTDGVVFPRRDYVDVVDVVGCRRR